MTRLGRSRGQSFPVNRDGVLHEEFNAYGGEACGGGAARAMRRRLVREEEPRALDGKSGDGAIQAP